MVENTFKSSSDKMLESCVLKKLERLSNNSVNKVLGEKLFDKHQLELAPFNPVKFSKWGKWEQDPLNNRSWQWRLNWLSFLSYLMAYHRAAGDDAVLDSARDAIQSWLDTYLQTDTEYPFEFIWHDHATALRAEQIVFFAYYCREFAPEWADSHSDFLAYLEQSLMVHGQWLAKDSFYSEHTNHGLEQARVLLLLGTIFEGEQAQEWQEIAIRRISNELEFAFTDEGVHVENSPAYHIFVFKVFIGILKDYPEEVLGDLAEQFNQFSGKALSFITHILRPDGTLPPIGDTEQLPTSDAYRDMFSHRLEYQHFLYALTQGTQGVKPTALNRVYPRSGYAIFRDQWPAKEHYQKAFHLIAKVGCSSRYHHQQDEGHISLYAGGEDWLIDSGLYNYINKDPVRKYMRGRPGHNVPIISHARYDEEFEHRLSAWKVTEYSEAESTPQLTMALGVLPPVTHQRKVSFDATTKIVQVEDRVSADDNQLRNVTLQWHFPKDKTLVIEDSQVVVTSPTGNRLTIEFEGEIPDNLSVAKGHKEERVFSCISYKANQVEPSQVLRVVFKERSILNVITRFHFAIVK
ncbi:heparinase II/III family protein [Vibrio metschnikovii]|uniref:Alginate lyase family protein n=1 Tax=Vibrio metschnikovii TaxID=28172 RepID=A0A9X0RAU0_VIBME|nr:heparinase II/III family protein [Vibrio metschnikovii]MBC5851941.1 alginate lyase family protein [Vibrio metschnikovii]